MASDAPPPPGPDATQAARIFAIEKAARDTRIRDLTFIAVVIIVYLYVIVMIIRRRDLQPIKLKGYKLITMSLIGSVLIIVADFLVKILNTYIIAYDEIQKIRGDDSLKIVNPEDITPVDLDHLNDM